MQHGAAFLDNKLHCRPYCYGGKRVHLLQIPGWALVLNTEPLRGDFQASGEPLERTIQVQSRSIFMRVQPNVPFCFWPTFCKRNTGPWGGVVDRPNWWLSLAMERCPSSRWKTHECPSVEPIRHCLWPRRWTFVRSWPGRCSIYSCRRRWSPTQTCCRFSACRCCRLSCTRHSGLRWPDDVENVQLQSKIHWWQSHALGACQIALPWSISRKPLDFCETTLLLLILLRTLSFRTIFLSTIVWVIRRSSRSFLSSCTWNEWNIQGLSKTIRYFYVHRISVGPKTSRHYKLPIDLYQYTII